MIVIKNQLINYILKIYKQTLNLPDLPPNTTIKCLDAIDYFNTLKKEESEIDEKYLSSPAVLISKKDENIIYVNETEIIGANRYFSLEAFLSILSSIYIDSYTSVKDFTQKRFFMFKNKIIKGFEMVKSFHSNLMAFTVLDILFETEDSPYKDMNYKEFLSKFNTIFKNVESENEKIDYLAYLLSKIKIFSKYSNTFSVTLTVEKKKLYEKLNSINICEKIKYSDLICVNSLYKKCIVN